MNILEEEYKDRFKDLSSLEGLDAEKIWAGVSNELDQMPASTKSNQGNTIKWSVLLLLLFLFAGFLFYYLKNQKPNHLEQAKKSSSTPVELNDLLPSSNQNIDKSFQNKKTESSKTIINSPTTTKNSGIKKNQNQETTQNREKTSPVADYSITINPKETSSIQPSTIEKNNDSDISVSTNSSNKTEDSESLVKDDKEKKNEPSDSSIKKSTPRSTLFSTQTIPTLNSFIAVQYPKQLSIKSFKSPSIVKVNKSSYFQFALLSGTNLSFVNYKKGNTDGSFLNELNSSTFEKPGWSNSFRISWIKDNRFSINSGIDHDLVRLKFSTIKETMTTVTDDQYLVRFGVDPISRDTINHEYESVELDALSKRTVVHHNRFNIISIPFEIGFQNKKGRFGYGINLGLSTNFFISQEGKTLNEFGEIFIINDEVSDQLPFKKFFIAYQLNPFIDYQLSSQIKLRLNPVLKYQTLGNSSLYKLNQDAILAGLNAGVVFRLRN